MTKLTVVTMDEQQMEALLGDKIREALEAGRRLEPSFGKWVVDRKFLTRNFKWSRRRIEALEQEKKIVPVFAGDGKSKHYNLAQCKAVYDQERH